MWQIRRFGIGLLIAAWLMTTQLHVLLQLIARSDAFYVSQAYSAIEGPASVMRATFYVPIIVTLFCLGAGLTASWLIDALLEILLSLITMAPSIVSRAKQIWYSDPWWRR